LCAASPVVMLPDIPFTACRDPTPLDVVGEATRGASGTRVRYWSDPQIFLPDAHFQYDELADRARQTAFLVPGLGITVTDERGVVRDENGEVVATRTEEFRYEGGISEVVDHLARSEEHTSELQSRFDTVCRILLD